MDDCKSVTQTESSFYKGQRWEIIVVVRSNEDLNWEGSNKYLRML